MGKIPAKFAKSGKSFVAKLSEDATKSTLSNFCAFPVDVHFAGKDRDEEVVLMVRQDLAVFIPQYLMILALLIAPFIFFGALRVLGLSGGSIASLGLGATVVFTLLAFTMAVDTFLKWFFSVNIITDQRLVDVDFSNVLYHRFSETQLENVQDVTHSVAGFLGSIFDYGSVYIQTAGTKPEFEFENIPRPRDVQDVLLDLLELKQKGKI